MVLETAINGQADVIVTFNIRHLAAAAVYFDVAVQLPAAVCGDCDEPDLSLRLPKSIRRAAEDLARDYGVRLNQFSATAVTSQVQRAQVAPMRKLVAVLASENQIDGVLAAGSLREGG